MTTYTDLQLDALRELANVGSGTAATALSTLVGKSIDVSVPAALALPLADAVDAVGPPETEVTAVVLPTMGDIDAVVVLVFKPDAIATVSALLGVEPGSELGLSALGEVGNILGSSYVGAFSSMTGLDIEPCPPQTVSDMLGAIVESILVLSAGNGDVALMLDSDLRVEGEACSFSFMLVPTPAGVAELLARLGLGG